jgi:hypothetical protein
VFLKPPNGLVTPAAVRFNEKSNPLRFHNDTVLALGRFFKFRMCKATRDVSLFASKTALSQEEWINDEYCSGVSNELRSDAADSLIL